METHDIYTSSVSKTGGDAVLPRLETCLLKFMWVCSNHLDNVDLVKTAILIRSLAVGKRMVRTQVCDILAEFTRLLRCPITDKHQRISETQDTSFMKYRETTESCLTNNNAGNNNNIYNCNPDNTEDFHEYTETDFNQEHSSYTSPFEYFINVDYVLQNLNMSPRKESKATKPNTGNLNKNLFLTVNDVSKTIETFTQRYSNYLYGLDRHSSVQDIRRSSESKESHSELHNDENESHQETVDMVPSSTEVSLLELSGCLLQQSEWLETVVKGKTPEKYAGCENEIQIEDVNEDKEDLVLTELRSMAESFLPIWRPPDQKPSNLVNQENGKEERCLSENSSFSRKEHSDYKNNSTILDEISMDISDSFDEWFADSRNTAHSDLLKVNRMIESKGVPSTPAATDIRTSTPLSPEEVPDNDEQNPNCEMTSLWPELPKIGHNTRRRLWEDTDIGVSTLTPLENSPKARKTNSEADIKHVKQHEGNSARFGKFDNDFQSCNPSNQVTPTGNIVSSLPSKSSSPIPPYVTPSIKESSQLQSSSLQDMQSMGQGQSQPCPMPREQMFQQQKDQMNVNPTWAQMVLDGLLPQQPALKSSPYSRGLNSIHGNHTPPYRLWAEPKNPSQHGWTPNAGDKNSVRASTIQEAHISYPLDQSNEWWNTHTSAEQNDNSKNIWRRPAGEHMADNFQFQSAQLTAYQNAIRLQVQQPPPPIETTTGGLQYHTGIPTVPIAKQNHHLQQPGNNRLPVTVQTAFNYYFRQELEKRCLLAPELQYGKVHHGNNPSGTNTAFRPLTTQTAQQSIKHYQQQQYQQQRNMLQHQQQQRQQFPIQHQEQYSVQQRPLHETHGMADALPPWTRTRAAANNLASNKTDIGVTPFTYGAWSGRQTPFEQVKTQLSDKFPGQEGKRVVPEPGFPGVYGEDLGRARLQQSNTNISINNTLSSAQYNNAMVGLSSNGAGRKDSGFETWQQQQQRQFQQLQQHHFQQQQHRQLQQQKQSAEWTCPVPYTPRLFPHPNTNTYDHFPAAYDTNFRAIMQAFSPQMKQQQMHPAVPTMAEAAWANLGLSKVHSQLPITSNVQRL